MATSGGGGGEAGSSSFSAWFKEAERNGGDILASSASTSSSFSAAALPAINLPPWLKAYAPAGVFQHEAADDLESGELISKSSTASASASASTSIDTDDYALSRAEKFKWFVTLLALGCFFFILAFFFLGAVLLFPGKFAFSFTCGSLSVMSAFVLVQGFESWRREVCQPARLWFTLSYFGSIAGTLFATLYLRNYFCILAFSAMQLSSLGWYFATYVPGGQHGMRMISAVVRTTCSGCVKACRLCVGV